MPTTEEDYCPYMSLEALGTALTGMCRRKLPDEVTAKWLGGFGLSKDTANRVLKALEFLGFLDIDRAPTDRLREYVRARDRRKRELIAEATRSAYGNVVDEVESLNASVDQTESLLGSCEPITQRRKMALLLLRLCKVSGIGAQQTFNEFRDDPLNFGKSRTTRTRRRTSTQPVSDSPRPKAHENAAIWGLSLALPDLGSVFPEVQREAWLESMRNAFILAYEDEPNTAKADTA